MQELNWDDIVIVGDSFARCRNELTHWPLLLTLRLTGEQYSHDRVLRGKGIGGASWWSTRNCLLSELRSFPIKVLIICHTEHSRIPSEQDLGLNAGGIVSNNSYTKNGKVIVGDKIAKAALEYYKELFNPKFSIWAQERWYEELDGLIEKHQIPYVIHMHCFNNEENKLYKFRNGTTGTEILSNFAAGMGPETPNHFLPETNIRIADALYDNLINYTNTATVKSLNLFDN